VYTAAGMELGVSSQAKSDEAIADRSLKTSPQCPDSVKHK